MKEKIIIKLEDEREGVVSFSDKCVEISGIKILASHEQDCSENVYADFSVFEFYKNEIEKEKIRGIEIKKVEDMGFIIFVECKYYRIGVLVNCYNEQNGYYSDELEVKVYKDGKFIEKFNSDKCDLIY